VQSAGTWLFMVERAVIGPRDLGLFWMPLSTLLSVLNTGVQTVLLACLLSAAVDRVLGQREMAARAVFDAPTQPHPMVPAPRESSESSEELSPSMV
jgi:hypothetical protein